MGEVVEGHGDGRREESTEGDLREERDRFLEERGLGGHAVGEASLLELPFRGLAVGAEKRRDV